MSPEIQEYFETYFELFSSDGWKQFMKDVKTEYQNVLSQMPSLETGEQMLVRKGELARMDWVAGTENIVRFHYDNMLAEEKAKAEDDADL